MSTQLPLRCRCGRVRGVVGEVSPESGNRLICYCDDCQVFARFLGTPGVMDDRGGTDIFQVAPARMKVTEGGDALRCVRLTEKGLYRWYTECCRTPAGNTLPRVPFVGIAHCFMDHEADGRAREDVLGKPLGLIQGRFAVGGLPPGAQRVASFGLVARCARVILGWWITGKGAPTPFFDPKTRAPRIEPYVLRANEREALRQAGAAVVPR
jgi:hypothetical protein